MSFDSIAPHYRWLEWVTAGSLLQRCRLAFLGQLANARNILLLGEGRGRFLLPLLRLNLTAQVTCLDSSVRMLELVRASLANANATDRRVRFVHQDILTLTQDPRTASETFGDNTYDGVASHFFLDCFPSDHMQVITSLVAEWTAPGAPWLISDFRVPNHGWQRVRARLILAGLYLFFRKATHLSARRLTPPNEALRGSGFRLAEQRYFNCGLLHSDLWVKQDSATQAKPPGRDRR